MTKIDAKLRSTPTFQLSGEVTDLFPPAGEQAQSELIYLPAYLTFLPGAVAITGDLGAMVLQSSHFSDVDTAVEMLGRGQGWDIDYLLDKCDSGMRRANMFYSIDPAAVANAVVNSLVDDALAWRPSVPTAPTTFFDKLIGLNRLHYVSAMLEDGQDLPWIRLAMRSAKACGEPIEKDEAIVASVLLDAYMSGHPKAEECYHRLMNEFGNLRMPFVKGLLDDARVKVKDEIEKCSSMDLRELRQWALDMDIEKIAGEDFTAEFFKPTRSARMLLSAIIGGARSIQALAAEANVVPSELPVMDGNTPRDVSLKF